MSSTGSPIKTLLNTKIPAEVWHYTTLPALEGILSSGKIWATDVRFTNDKTEFIHGRAIVNEYLNSIKPDETRFLFPKLSGVLPYHDRRVDLIPLTPFYIGERRARSPILNSTFSGMTGERPLQKSEPARFVTILTKCGKFSTDTGTRFQLPILPSLFAIQEKSPDGVRTEFRS
jgi:hypothetical protein